MDYRPGEANLNGVVRNNGVVLARIRIKRIDISSAQ